jgi:hypothetical protein
MVADLLRKEGYSNNDLVRKYKVLVIVIYLLIIHCSGSDFTIFKGDGAVKQKSSWHVIQDQKTESAEFSANPS